MVSLLLAAALLAGAPQLPDTTTFRDAATAELYARARVRHIRQDELVHNYRALVRMRLEASAGRSRFARQTTRRYRDLMDEPALLGRHLTISYEEVAADAKAVFDEKIWPFLGLPPVPVSTVLRKQIRLPVEECVANLDDLRSALATDSERNPLAPFHPESALPHEP